MGLQHWKGGTGEGGFFVWTSFVPQLQRQHSFLCASMPNIGTTTLAVSRVRR